MKNEQTTIKQSGMITFVETHPPPAALCRILCVPATDMTRCNSIVHTTVGIITTSHYPFGYRFVQLPEEELAQL